MKSTITFVAFAGYVAAQQGYGPPAYVPPSYDTTTSTAPAQYPTTTSSQSVPQYPTTTSSKAAYPSCPAPGVTENGCYSCNPAHQYPEGQTCEYKDGCPCLVYHTTSQPPSYPTTTSSEPPKYPTTTSTSVEKPYPSCPAPGVTEHGCYSCNPAHQYPEGQTCEYKDGCPCLVTKTSSIPSYPTSSSSSQPPKYPTTTSTTVAKPYPSCPAPGTTEHGCYSCNPAHQYPEGQTCEYKDGCPCLVTKSSTIPSYPTTTKTSDKPVPTCPAPGKTENGCYSCNPAHQYPEGQSCEDVKGCPCLVTKTSTKPSYPTAPVYTTKVVTELTTYCPQPTTFTHQQTTYTITSATTLTLPCKGGCTVTQTKSYPAPSATPSCPAPGKTENGCYSCNPAHQYPAGNKCELVKGCYCLYTPPAPTTKVYVNTTQPPVYTTKVVTDYTTYCPSPTTFTHEQKTYTVTKPTTVTLPCEHGCTVTTKITPPPTTVTKVYTPPVETHPVAPPPSKPVETHPVATPSKPVETHPVAPPPVYTPPVETHPVATPSKPVETHPVAPPPYPTKETHTAPAPSQPSATRPAASTTQPVQYTGAAAPMKTGVPMLAAVAMGALFL